MKYTVANVVIPSEISVWRIYVLKPTTGAAGMPLLIGICSEVVHRLCMQIRHKTETVTMQMSTSYCACGSQEWTTLQCKQKNAKTQPSDGQ